jgi:hypothetical protein
MMTEGIQAAGYEGQRESKDILELLSESLDVET